MRVDSPGMSHANHHGMNAQEKRIRDKDSGDSGDVRSAAGEAQAGSADSAPRGVIRNLMEGHYKGVADVRLRINFADELAALEQSRQADMVAERAQDLLGQTREKSAEISDSGLLNEDQQQTVDGLTETLADEVESLLGGEQPNDENLATGLQTAFEQFAFALQASLFSEPVEGGGAQTGVSDPAAAEAEDILSGATAGVELAGDLGAAAEEGSAATADPLQVFVEELQSSIAAAFASLEKDLGGLSQLPELSDPEGQGAAYEKFLSIYQAMSGDQPTPGDDAAAPPDAAGTAGI